jgi:hypothetical protein
VHHVPSKSVAVTPGNRIPAIKAIEDFILISPILLGVIRAHVIAAHGVIILLVSGREGHFVGCQLSHQTSPFVVLGIGPGPTELRPANNR